MALTPKGYTTKAEVQDYLFADLDPAYDAALDDLIAKAEAYIERKTRRTFDQPAGPLAVTSRFGDVLVIPDTRSLSAVEIDPYFAAAYSAGEEGFNWRLEPIEAPNSGRPYTRLRLMVGSTLGQRAGWPSSFPEPGKVTLTGEFGWDAVPAEIRMATTMLVAEATRKWRDSNQGEGIQSYSLGDFSVTFGQTGRDPQFRSWIIPYIKPRVRNP